MYKKLLLLLLLFIGIIQVSLKDVYALENGWEEKDGFFYYYENGELVKGLKEIENNWYHFGENSGQLKIGLSQLLDGRIYYSDSNGVLEQGWIHTNDQTYYFDLDSGAYKGIHQIGEDWYHFGEYSGQLKIGWSKLLDGRVYYSDQEGILQQGWVHTDDQTYFFDIDFGAYKGIHQIGDDWYHFGENSGQLKYGNSKTLDGRIYYSNEEGIIQLGWYTSNQQTYYYTAETGAYKGIHQIGDDWYHFGEYSGQLKYGLSQLLDGRIYYSDSNGVLEQGWVHTDDQTYFFDLDTGAYKGIHQISEDWYHFGENSGQLKIGWSQTLNKKRYYSNEEGILQKGNIVINDNVFVFNDDYSLKTGWQEINGELYYIESKDIYYVEQTNNNGVVLINKIDGKLVTGIYRDSNNHIRYLTKDGKRVKGWVIENDLLYYFDDNDIAVIGEKTIENEVCQFDENGIYQKKQTIPVYYTQTDYRWYNIKYGTRTLKATGCAPTSMAMAFSAIKKASILPTDVANYLYYQTNEFNHYTIGSSGLAIVYATNYYNVKRTPIQNENQLKIALARGKIVFAAMGDGKFGTPRWNHAIVVYNYQRGQTYALDPLKEENNGWVSIDQLLREQSKDPDDSRGGSNFYMLG